MNGFSKSTLIYTIVVILALLTIFFLAIRGMNHTPKSSILEVLPHDENMFTQGFFIEDSIFWESSGAPNTIPRTRTVFWSRNSENGKIEILKELDKKEFFGEWFVRFKEKFYWIMYKWSRGFIYDANSLEQIREFSFPSREWWGLTHNNTHLIMSDGTNLLTTLDPDTLEVVKTTEVLEWWKPVPNLNELEYIDGYIYANIWLTNDIVKIDYTTGQVIKRYRLDEIAEHEKSVHPNAQEMNGIAYDHDTGDLYVTGKMWKHIYSISLDVLPKDRP